MGMYGTLRRATTEEAARLRATPSLVRPFLYGDEPEPIADEPRDLLGSLLRFTPLSVRRVADMPAASRPATPAWPPPADGDHLDLDKTWHGLHFLFTGEADGGPEPASFLLVGGEDVGEDRYGEPLGRLLSPARVRDVSAFLAGITEDDLRGRFDPARMTELEIYPDEIWQRPEEADAPLGYLLGAFTGLKAFMRAAAERGDSVVVGVS